MMAIAKAIRRRVEFIVVRLEIISKVDGMLEKLKVLGCLSFDSWAAI